MSARRLLLVSLAVVLVAFARPSVSIAAHGTAHQPYELWRTFPLGRKAHAPLRVPSTSSSRVPARPARIPPASSTPGRPSSRPGHGTPFWSLAYLILALTGVTAATMILRQRRPTRLRSRAPYAPSREGRLAALVSRMQFRERLTHLSRVSRYARPLRPPDPGPVTESPEDPLRSSTTLRVLARLHDAGVLDDDQFAAKQAEVLQADSLRALAELHDMGLLDDDQFAVKTAEIRDGSTPAV